MIVVKTVAGPSAYPTGGFNVTIGELEKVSKAFVQALGLNEYIAQVASITGNVVRVAVRDNIEQAVNEGGTATYTVGGEVAAGADLSGVTFVVVAEGY